MKFQVVIFAKNLKLNNKSATLYLQNRYITLEISYIIHIFSKALRLLCLKFVSMKFTTYTDRKYFALQRGKEHKPYEFGNKSSFAYTCHGGIIVGAMAIEGNAFDGHTLKPQLDQVKELTGGKTRKAIVDPGSLPEDPLAHVRQTAAFHAALFRFNPFWDCL
jgi:hypothetical protein